MRLRRSREADALAKKAKKSIFAILGDSRKKKGEKKEPIIIRGDDGRQRNRGG